MKRTLAAALWRMADRIDKRSTRLTAAQLTLDGRALHESLLKHKRNTGKDLGLS